MTDISYNVTDMKFFGDSWPVAGEFETLVLLALVRNRWGDIARCIGLHAGFVMSIAVFRKISVPVSGSEWSFLVSSFDGLVGTWIALLTALVCAVLWLQSRFLK